MAKVTCDKQEHTVLVELGMKRAGSAFGCD